MTRTALTLLTAAGLSAWAAAQVPPAPLAIGQARLLTANRDLLQALLTDGLAASDAGDSTLDRIAACRRAAQTLSRSLKEECQRDAPDADRVAELGDHLGEVLKDGLAPALDRARAAYHDGSPDFPKFRDLDKQSAADARAAAGLIPAAGKLGDRGNVRDARGRLTAAAGKFPE